MTKQCKYKTRCNQGDLGKLEACNGKYERCIIYQRFASLEDTAVLDLSKLDGVTYEDWLGVGAIVKLPGDKLNKDKDVKTK